MIHTQRQLKALVQNISLGDSAKAQVLIRNYIMERFLERINASKYHCDFILKGGMLVSAMVGLDVRSTMDMDTTIQNRELSLQSAHEILAEIIDISIDDNVHFTIKNVAEIMNEAEYTGIRAVLEGEMDGIRTPLKLDISTGDVITPREINYDFKLMFEERTIPILAYNIETILAEKLETVLSRGTANTRLRDYYDLYVLKNDFSHTMDNAVFTLAFAATCKKRNSIMPIQNGALVLKEIWNSQEMQQFWKSYQNKYAYAKNISWDSVMGVIQAFYELSNGDKKRCVQLENTVKRKTKDRER